MLGEFGFGGGPDGEAGAVVEEEVEGLDVVDGFATHQRVDTAGVVADHAADGAAAVRGRVGGESEGEFLCGVADAVEDDAGFDVNRASLCVDCAHAVHVLREVKDDGSVAALSGKRGARSAREDGRVEGATDGDGGDDIGFVAWNDDADGNVTVVGAVGGIEGLGGGVEAYFSADVGTKLVFEFFGLGEGVVGASVGARQKDEWGGGHYRTALQSSSTILVSHDLSTK